MRYAILSDVHANLEALERVLADAERCGADEIVCLGDIVGYGPLPQKTLALVRARCSVVLAGNHDDAVSGRGDASAFIDLAGDAVRRHREALDADALAWLKALPYHATVGEALAAHGDAVDPPRFYYVEDTEDAAANFSATDVQLTFVGHTHVPGIFLTGRSGTVYQTAPQDFTLEDGKRYIVNPGSVGYPREANGQCQSSYVIYDTDDRSVAFRFLPFSVASVMQRGQSPRRIRKAVLAAALLGVAALAVTGTLLLRKPKRIVETETETVVVDREDTLVAATKTLAVPPAAKAARANLVLAKGSAPVSLRVTSLAGGTETTDPERSKVSKSNAREWKLPDGTDAVRFDVLKIKPEDTPAIRSFEPTWR